MTTFGLQKAENYATLIYIFTKFLKGTYLNYMSVCGSVSSAVAQPGSNRSVFMIACRSQPFLSCGKKWLVGNLGLVGGDCCWKESPAPIIVVPSSQCVLVLSVASVWLFVFGSCVLGGRGANSMRGEKLLRLLIGQPQNKKRSPNRLCLFLNRFILHFTSLVVILLFLKSRVPFVYVTEKCVKSSILK